MGNNGISRNSGGFISRLSRLEPRAADFWGGKFGDRLYEYFHSTAGMWSSVDCTEGAPCARGKHSAALLDGWVYVLGGRGAGGALPLRDFWRYCLGDGRWERLECRGDPPPALQEHSTLAHGARLYVFGGEAGALGTETPLWIYDTETKFWRKLPGQPNPSIRSQRARGVRGVRGARGAGGAGVSGPRGRRGHSAHALKDCLLVYGGYRDLRGSTNELWAFHYETETWHQVKTANAGPARHRHAAVLHDNKLYVHGGQWDLRECNDLWHYDTMSRVWSQVRTPAKQSPAARSGHAGLRAGAHLYIFGGESGGHVTNELWRLHFATDTWERIVNSMTWPSPRVDCCVLLIPHAPPRARAAPLARASHNRHSVHSRPDPPQSLFREISKLSTFHIRRSNRCSYSVLAADQDSTESLVRQETAVPPLSKSHSAYVIDKRQPADGGESPREGDEAEKYRCDIAREPISVPDFADMILPTPVLSPVEAAKLVYLDSDEEEDMRREMREMELLKRQENGVPMGKESEGVETKLERVIVAIPKSASVRFTNETTTLVTTEDEAELSTSDYASAERVNRLSGTSSLGFCNPHYLGPDVRNLGQALTPDSGVGPGDIELQDLSEKKMKSILRNPETQLHLLLIGGKEPPHVALLQRPLSLWTYRLL